MKKQNVTLKMVKELIRELKGQARENAIEMRHNAKVLDRQSFAEAAHIDSVNGCLYYIINELQKIVTHSK